MRNIIIVILFVLGAGAATQSSEFQEVFDSVKESASSIVNIEESEPVAGSSEILSRLVELTDEQDPGPTKNYYWFNGKAKIDSEKMPAKGKVSFKFDSKRRSGIARASLTYQMFEESRGSRQGTPLDPPGWPSGNPKVAIPYKKTGKTYNGFMWNRSHSVGDSLAGAQSYTSAANFTTGTRPQNVGADQNGGMRAAEQLAENYWKDNPGSNRTIWYQTSPLYNGNEKLPRGSIVDILSSDGKLNREVIVINAAEGHDIDYKTGSFTTN